MSFKSLLESSGECGQTNPMIDLARQITSSSSTNNPTENDLSTNLQLINERFDHNNDNTISAVESLLFNNNNANIDDNQFDQSSVFNMESLLEEMNRMEAKFMETNNNNDSNNEQQQQQQPPDSINSIMKTNNDPFWNDVTQNIIFDNDGFNQQQQQQQKQMDDNNKLPELNVDWADEYLRKLELNNNNNNNYNDDVDESIVKQKNDNLDNDNLNVVNGSWDLNEKMHQRQTNQRQSLDYRDHTVDDVNEFFQQQQQPQSFTPFLRPIMREGFVTTSTIDDANLNDLVSDQEKRLINMLLGNNNKNSNNQANENVSSSQQQPQQLQEQEQSSSSTDKIDFKSKLLDHGKNLDENIINQSLQQQQQQENQESTKSNDEIKTDENFFYENQFDDMEFWMKLAEEWHSNDVTSGDLFADIDANVVQIREPLENLLKNDHRYFYKFTENNPFIVKEEIINKSKEKETKDLVIDYIEQGKQRMNVGDLSAAVLLFEAATQQKPESVEAWHLLGIANAKNENDHKSISAFKRCLSLLPKDENIILESLMYLASSFTNESMTTEACNALQEWLNNNSKYRDLINKKETDEPYLGPTPLSKRWIQKTARVGNPFSNGLFDSVRENFLEAARMTIDQQPDPDVQCGLGVLHNLSGEYEKAIDCFALALESRPDDYSLWNRYGASLANGGRAEDSMSAYREALIRYPGYIRARYNLAISCVMMGLGEEAAEHLLSVLKLQTAGADSIKDMVDLNRDNITSSSVWSLLRSAMSMHGRIDLFDLVDKRDLEQLLIEFYKTKSKNSDDNVDEVNENGNNDNNDNDNNEINQNQSNIE